MKKSLLSIPRALLVITASLASFAVHAQSFNSAPVPRRNVYQTYQTYQSNTTVVGPSPTWANLQGVPGPVQSIGNITPTSGSYVLGNGSGFSMVAQSTIGVQLPIASAGVQPYACTASTKGKKAMTSAGHECTCDGSVWRDNFSVSLVSGLLNLCSW